MKVFFSILIIGFVLVGLLFSGPLFSLAPRAQGQQQEQQSSAIIPGEYIVTLKLQSVITDERGNSSPEIIKENVIEKAQQANESLEAQGGGGYVDEVYDLAIQGFSVKGVDNPLALLQDPDVLRVEPNRALTLDAQYLATDITRIGLDKASTTNYRPDRKETKLDVDIAVIDTIVHPHPDLNIYRSVRMLTQNDAKVETHGTHVAGICCARDNLGGVVGTAQGARIWSIHICGGTSGSCPEDKMIAAFNYVVANANEIDVATMSCCGGGPNSQAAEDASNAMITAGVVFFRSAGNTGSACQVDWGCDHNNAIVVSNLQDFDGKCGGLRNSGSARDDSLAPSSTYGSQIDLMAPGSNIISTYPPGVSTNLPSETYPYIGTSEQGAYAILTGTSMATPAAAGVGALVVLNNPSFTHSQVKTNLQSNAYSQSQSCDGASKGGLVTGANSKGTEKILWAGNY